MTLGSVLTIGGTIPIPLEGAIARGAGFLIRLWERTRLRFSSDGGSGRSRSPGSEARADDPDRALLLEILAAYPHDTSAYSLLVRRHWRRVWTLCQGVLVNPHDAEEATQDTFLKVHRHLPRFRFDSRFATWLHRVAVNTALSLHASRRRETGVIERLTRDPLLLSRWLPKAAPGPERLREDLRLALEAMDPRDRAIVVLHVLEGIPYDDLAEALEMSPGAVRMRAMRARERLRDLLGEFGVD
jgi:RNA polymerase sigma-70 factor (ECF subfamily)